MTVELPENIKILADKCNSKHVKVVNAILSGEYPSNTKVYQSVYQDSSNDTARANVSSVLALTSVSAYKKACEEAAMLKTIATRIERLKRLDDIATGKAFKIKPVTTAEEIGQLKTSIQADKRISEVLGGDASTEFNVIISPHIPHDEKSKDKDDFLADG